MKMEETECSETLAYKIWMPGNYPEERTQHSEHGKSLKSRINYEMFIKQKKFKCNSNKCVAMNKTCLRE